MLVRDSLKRGVFEALGQVSGLSCMVEEICSKCMMESVSIRFLDSSWLLSVARSLSRPRHCSFGPTRRDDGFYDATRGAGGHSLRRRRGHALRLHAGGQLPLRQCGGSVLVRILSRALWLGSVRASCAGRCSVGKPQRPCKLPLRQIYVK